MKEQKRKILLIGGTGMLGRPVALSMKNAGFDVRILSRTPDKAKIKLPTRFDVFEGDVTKVNSLQNAMEGCYGVHINLGGGITEREVKTMEHEGVLNIIKAANMCGIQKLTYISGATISETKSDLYFVRAKQEAEAAIKSSGLNYTIFKPSWFMESLPSFIRNNKALIPGEQRTKYHWVAADDYAEIVTKAFITKLADNKTVYVYGPETYSIEEALRKYCASVHPGMVPSTLPLNNLKLLAVLSFNKSLKHMVKLFGYFQQATENHERSNGQDALGTPTITLNEWINTKKL